MSFIALYDLDMISVDAKKFFTQNNLRERVYCEQMEGHVQGGYLPDGRPKKVCLLTRVYMHLEKTKYMYANPLTKVDTIEDFLRFRKFSMNE